MLRRKQRGSLILDLAIGMAVLSVLGVMAIKYVIDETYEQRGQMTLERVNYLRDEISRYFTDQVTINGVATSALSAMPADYATLEAAQYVDPCPVLEYEAGRCIQYNRVPFGDDVLGTSEIGFERLTDSQGYPFVRLTVNLNALTDIRQKLVVRSYLQRIPGYIEDAAEVVTYDVQRPSTAMAYDRFVKVDGSTPLEDHWDVGGFNLENVGDIEAAAATFDDISIRDYENVTVATGLIYSMGHATHNNVIPKPICPAGLNPMILTSMGHLLDTYNGNRSFRYIGAAVVRAVDLGASWRIEIQVVDRDNNENQYISSSGVANYWIKCDV